MHIIDRPCIPLETPIYGGMNHDATVDIHGEPHSGHHNGFTVDFHSREGIAFHMSVRMGHCGENVIVMNNMKHGCWHHEERHHNVFHCGHHFHLKIKNHHGHFSIHVNGHHLAHFHHREDPHHIHALHIKGDLHVEKIHFEHFHGHNGGGIQVGSVGMMPMPGPMVVAPPPPPQIVMAPPPPVFVPPPPVFNPAPVVVIEEGHHHHHRHHGLFHHLRHHHHHHHDHCD